MIEIDAGLTTLSAGFSVQTGIDAATEGQTGIFPTEIGVSLDDGPRYSTPPTGCSATLTEHEHDGTPADELDEQRAYRVVGTASCTEPALRDDGMAGQITLSDVAFRIPAIWSDQTSRNLLGKNEKCALSLCSVSVAKDVMLVVGGAGAPPTHTSADKSNRARSKALAKVA